jgi:hypothetical protein
MPPMTLFKCSRCGLATAWDMAVANRSKLNPTCPNCHRPLTDTERMDKPEAEAEVAS